MRTQTQARADAEKQISDLCADGLSFSVKQTANSTTIYFDGMKHRVEVPVDSADGFLPLYAKVKSDADRFMSTYSDFSDNGEKIKYFGFSIEPEIQEIAETKEDSILIDITGAYWEMARRLFLSEETFNFGNENKPARLKSLGALAAMTIVTDYLDGQPVNKKTFRPNTASLFYHCSREIGKITDAAFGIFDCIGFWFDCVFTNNKSDGDLIIEFFKKNGFNTKLKEGQGGYVLQNDIYYYIFEADGEKKGYPAFSLSQLKTAIKNGKLNNIANAKDFGGACGGGGRNRNG